MAAAETARLIASLDLKDNMSKGLSTAERNLGKLDSTAFRVGQHIGKGMQNAAANIAKLGVVAGAVAGGLLVKSIANASDLNETISKTNVVFGKASAEVLKFGDTSAASLGLSKNAALTAASTYGNLFVSMGLATDKSADMSTSLVKLAGDLASFNNLDPTEVTEKLRAGLTGESEPLKSLGININETIIKAKALELGLVKTTASTSDLKLKTVALKEAQKDAAAATKKYGAGSQQALTATVKAEKAQAALESTTKKIPAVLDAATKAQAAYALIFEQSATAQGDFARTSTGLANQQRILKANFENISATLGTALLPSVAKLFEKINAFVVKSGPAIAELGAKLPAIFDRAVAFAEGIPWDQVASGLQAAGMFAKGLFDIFINLPPQVQGTIIALAGLNKLTGGAVSGIVGELSKGLIKGVLGINAGVVNVNGATVNGAGGIAGAAGKGGLGSILKFAGALGLATVALELWQNHLVPLNEDIAKQTTGIGEEVANTIATKTADQLVAERKALLDGLNGIFRTTQGLGPLQEVLYGSQIKALKESIALVDKELQNRDNSPEGREQRDALRRLVQSTDDRGRDARDLASTVTAMYHQLHADLLAQIGILKTSSDPAVIAAAVAQAVADIRGGAGSAKSTGGLLDTLKTQLAAAEASNNPELAQKIKDAIKQIEPFQKGRQWQQEQIAEARKVVDSNKSTADKVAALKGIQQGLLDHQRTMAAGIVGGLLDVVNAIHNIKLPAGQTPKVNTQTGFVTGGTPLPKGSTPKVNNQTGFVVNTKVNVSTKDVTTAQTVRGRIGPTPAQAGSI